MSSTETALKTTFVIGMLITGTINTISKKIQNDVEVFIRVLIIIVVVPVQHLIFVQKSEGMEGEVHTFTHPWFQTAVMFMGEALCIIPYLLSKFCCASESSAEPFRWKNIWLFIIPTICDLVGTSLAGIGLLFVSASVSQLLRGGIIIFSGILSVLFLKRVLLPYRWIGMMVVLVGLVVIGIYSFFVSESSQNSNLFLGIFLILGG